MATVETQFGTQAGTGAEKAAGAAMPSFVLPPLFAPSAGAMVAAAAVGLGFANQMAGAWLGVMKGAMETTRQMAEALGASEQDLVEVATAATVAEPVRESATILPLARKEKPVVTPVEKVAAAPAKTRKAAPKKAEPKKTVAAAAVDLSDLKLLPGVGPKLEQMLKARGIATLSDVAALKKAAADKLDAALGLDGRIARDGWVAKAAGLIG